jgi:hypothetical protein
MPGVKEASAELGQGGVRPGPARAVRCRPKPGASCPGAWRPTGSLPRPGSPSPGGSEDLAVRVNLDGRLEHPAAHVVGVEVEPAAHEGQATPVASTIQKRGLAGRRCADPPARGISHISATPSAGVMSYRRREVSPWKVLGASGGGDEVALLVLLRAAAGELPQRAADTGPRSAVPAHSQCRTVAAPAGRRKENVAPGPWLGFAHIRPPWPSTIERQIAKPMPMPCGLVV